MSIEYRSKLQQETSVQSNKAFYSSFWNSRITDIWNHQVLAINVDSVYFWLDLVILMFNWTEQRLEIEFSAASIIYLKFLFWSHKKDEISTFPKLIPFLPPLQYPVLWGVADQHYLCYCTKVVVKIHCYVVISLKCFIVIPVAH